MMKRKVALDVGDVRIGVAVSDMLGITANPRETYVRKKDDINADIAYFCEYAKKEDADAFVLGLPKNMDGTEGDRAAVSKQIGGMLEETGGLEVVYQGEKVTTGAAGGMLLDAGGRSGKRKKGIDKGGATKNFQSFFDLHR